MFVCMLSHVWLFATPWIVANQAPLSVGFSRQKYWTAFPSSEWAYFICYIRMSDRIDTFLGRIIFGFGLLHEIWRCSMAAYKKSTMVHGHCSSLSLRDWLPEAVLFLKENWSDLIMSSDAQHRALCTLWCSVLESRSRSMLSSGSPDVWVC